MDEWKKYAMCGVCAMYAYLILKFLNYSRVYLCAHFCCCCCCMVLLMMNLHLPFFIIKESIRQFQKNNQQTHARINKLFHQMMMSNDEIDLHVNFLNRKHCTLSKATISTSCLERRTIVVYIHLVSINACINSVYADNLSYHGYHLVLFLTNSQRQEQKQ